MNDVEALSNLTSQDSPNMALSAEEIETVVKRAFDLDINFFDAENLYSAGTNEEYPG